MTDAVMTDGSGAPSRGVCASAGHELRPHACRLTTHLMPEPFQPTLGLLPLLLALPTSVVGCFAASVQQRPLWILPLSLVLALCKVAAGAVSMPAALILGNSEVRARPLTLNSAARRLLSPLRPRHLWPHGPLHTL